MIKKGSTLASDHEFHYGVETAFSRCSTENCYCCTYNFVSATKASFPPVELTQLLTSAVLTPTIVETDVTSVYRLPGHAFYLRAEGIQWVQCTFKL